MSTEPITFKPRTSWKGVAAQLRETPGTWHLVATDVSTGTASPLRRLYGLETRLVGVDPVTKRCEKLYARYIAPEPIDASAPNPIARQKTQSLIGQLRTHLERHPEETRVIATALAAIADGKTS